ncbi:MAG: hypothetical protein DMD80_04575 [Candidatus Rokuibacteriota bacterium]|nr:MAG: hypothetical protein DMD80_04575 [Candidatus Rokubacteria bacterium]
MRVDIAAVALTGALLVFPGIGLTQTRGTTGGPPPAAQSKDEIKLDESTTLKAAALEARASALLANLALAQRQFQDMQQELQKILDERKALILDAAKKVNVEVKEPLEWALDNKGQRYQRVVRPSPR